jgi:magnesium transporter
MGKSVRKVSKKIGLPPGSLVHIGEQKIDNAKMTVIDYSKALFTERAVDKIEECDQCMAQNCVSWLNVNGLHDVALMDSIGKYFGLHTLVLEDIMNTKHRPKAEEYDDYLFFTLKMLHYNEETLEVENEQVSFVLGEYTIVSFQEKAGDVFEPIRERIRKGKGKVREKKTDYLVYLLIDIVIDNYYSVIEQLGNRLEELEELVLDNPPKDFLSTLQQLKKQLIMVRKAIYPLREAIGIMQKGETQFVADDTLKYFRDVYDHTITVIDSVETYRDMLSSIKDIYLSSLSNKMNNTMKVLTIMASIFIPLTFIAGVYGMNFKDMPELNSPYGYPGVWIAMIVTALGLIIYFKKRDWL